MPKVSSYPSASLPLTGAEEVYLVQSGNSRKATLSEAFNTTGTAPMYACRAWVNFDGTGTPSIRAAGNVSSITDNGVGDYTVNFATAMPDANFCAVASCRDNVGVSAGSAMTNSYSTGAVSIATRNPVTGAGFDPTFVNVAVFR